MILATVFRQPPTTLFPASVPAPAAATVFRLLLKTLFPAATAAAAAAGRLVVAGHFATAPVPQGFAEDAERNAQLMQAYFRAWTLDATRATFSVPYIGHLRGQCGTWEEALRQWLLQLPSAETKRYVGNFLSVYRVRPAAEADANSDDDDVDEPFQLEPAALANALRTQTLRRRRPPGKHAMTIGHTGSKRRWHKPMPGGDTMPFLGQSTQPTSAGTSTWTAPRRKKRRGDDHTKRRQAAQTKATPAKDQWPQAAAKKKNQQCGPGRKGSTVT